MTDEKRLDDEALEKVSGGGPTTQYRFFENNCHSCRHYNVDCPYGSCTLAFEELGSNVHAVCPYKE